MLTDKAKIDFEKWFREKKEVNFDFFNRNNKPLNVFVTFYSMIEWFDSVGLWNITFLEKFENGLGNFECSVKDTIKKCNEIYNLPHNHK